MEATRDEKPLFVIASQNTAFVFNIVSNKLAVIMHEWSDVMLVEAS